ncbi:MAG: methionine biosynthesis protein MetW [Rickettsiales bacterium]
MVLDLRYDLRAIADMVEPNSTLLDVGCGDGDLLYWLKKEKSVVGRGIELSQNGVNNCISKGLSVMQGNADTDLSFYPDKAYDYAVLSQTLQTLENPRKTLENLVRIADRTIVSVPNFGHWRNRLYLTFFGRMPVTRNLSYQWYDTPNIHFCTITDFMELCANLGLSVEKTVYITETGTSSNVVGYKWVANLFGQHGIFMLSG